MVTKIKNPLLKLGFVKETKQSLRRMSKHGIIHWSNYSIPVVQTGLDSLGISGDGFCAYIDKEALPVGDGCVLGCILQRDVEVAKISLLYFFKKDVASVWLEGFYKGDSVGRQNFALTHPLKLRQEVSDMARLLRVTFERDKQDKDRVAK